MTRGGKSEAKSIKTDLGVDRTKAIAAAHRIMALRKGITLGDGGTIKKLISEGRKDREFTKAAR